MKITAIAFLAAATIATMPAQARDLTTSWSDGNLTFSISTSNHNAPAVRSKHVERRGNRNGHRHFVPLSPRKIVRRLERRGYYNIRNMRTDGRTYTLKARGRRGNLVRLTVSARNGAVLNRRIVRRMERVDPRSYRSNRYDRAQYGWTHNYNRAPFWRR